MIDWRKPEYVIKSTNQLCQRGGGVGNKNGICQKS